MRLTLLVVRGFVAPHASRPGLDRPPGDSGSSVRLAAPGRDAPLITCGVDATRDSGTTMSPFPRSSSSESSAFRFERGTWPPSLRERPEEPGPESSSNSTELQVVPLDLAYLGAS